MKVIAINGSPRPIGNTSNILHEVQDQFEREGIEMEMISIYDYRFMNCNVCLTCEIRGDGRCQDEDDGFNEILDRLREADGVLIASPTYA
ncbi:MAG: flavodoxin family protein, partial [Candidatus Methanomethylophilaceae archaeon]|nr:flavodoxin family protein [Candidatus Methanomethylophilaceae archaeon]